ncbi:MAG: methionine--tRNA ligase [Candidatus Geothermarchaeales archaeon]
MAKWIVTSAWPYSSGVPHLGNFVGSLLSADVFARYLRLRGEDVLFVTGSDEHGTPIEVEAIKRGITPKELTDKVHGEIVEILKEFDISTDNYTRTHNPIHMDFVRNLFGKIYENDYIFARSEDQLYCSHDKIFLPDRFVNGTCPHCGYEMARGDQCENCGTLLDPTQLVDPKCSVCGNTPTKRETTHWYFDLPRFSERLKKFIEQSKTLSENAKSFSLEMIDQGLKPRSVTRSNKWGIPAPFPGAGEKTIYVWLEAVLGYVTAVVEYFTKKMGEDDWRSWWFDGKTNVAFFIGKDNIPFHTVILPSLLMATHDPYSLRFHVGATEFLTFEGRKFSKSMGVGIWLDEALKLLPSDYWRFALTLIRPEVKDTSFSWSHLEKSVNEELNNQLGNLVLRVLNLINRHFDGVIPKPKDLSRSEVSLLNGIGKTRDAVGEQMSNHRFQRALVGVMDLVRECNSLLNIEEPWKKVEVDRDAAGNTLYVVAFALKAIGIMLMPFIPKSASRILKCLGTDTRGIGWRDIETLFKEGQRVRTDLEPIFTKMETSELVEKLKAIREEEKREEPLLDLEVFSKLDIRVGEIVEAEPIKGREALLRLKIKIGEETKTSVAGIAQRYSPGDLIGRQVATLVNLKPRRVAGVSSEAMLLAVALEGGDYSLLVPDRRVPPGSRVC